MKIGLACVQTKPQDLSFNLDQVINIMTVSQKHQIDLVLFGEDFLGEQSLSIDAQALFRLKVASTYYDLALGVGFIQEGQKNYIIIDKSGEMIYNHLQQKEFTLNSKSFSLILGNEGFSAEKVDNILIWPILNFSTPKEWFNSELSKYRTHADSLSNESILVNSFIDGVAFGGGFLLKDNQFIVNQPMEQKGLSVLEI